MCLFKQTSLLVQEKDKEIIHYGNAILHAKDVLNKQYTQAIKTTSMLSNIDCAQNQLLKDIEKLDNTIDSNMGTEYSSISESLSALFEFKNNIQKQTNLAYKIVNQRLNYEENSNIDQLLVLLDNQLNAIHQLFTDTKTLQTKFPSNYQTSSTYA